MTTIEIPQSALHAIEFDLVLRADVVKDTARWQAITSTTKRDRMGEHTTPLLFYDWIRRIEKGIQVPFLPPPTMPYLSVSHYSDFGGLGVAGATDKMSYKPSDDGNHYIFRAAGTFSMDNPLNLGEDLLKRVLIEQNMVAKGENLPQPPMRVSAAWIDLAHRHGDVLFVRRSLMERCPLCEAGVGDKFYRQGQLVHFAVTRVPINPDTPFGLEERKSAAMPITKLDDAESLVSPEAARKLEELEKSEVAAARKSGALTVKAESDEDAGAEDAPAQPGDGENATQAIQTPEVDKSLVSPGLGKFVRTLRESNGQSLESVARSLTINPQALTDIERGRIVPAQPVLRSMARLWDQDAMRLVGLIPRGATIPETVEKMMDHYGGHEAMESMEAEWAEHSKPYKAAWKRSCMYGMGVAPQSFAEAEQNKADKERLEEMAECLDTGHQIILSILEDGSNPNRVNAITQALSDELDRAKKISAMPDETMAYRSETEVEPEVERAMATGASDQTTEEDEDEEDQPPNEPTMTKSEAETVTRADPGQQTKKRRRVHMTDGEDDAMGMSEDDMPMDEDEDEDMPMSSKSLFSRGDYTMSDLNELDLEALGAQIGQELADVTEQRGMTLDEKYRQAEQIIGGYAYEVQRAFLDAEPQQAPAPAQQTGAPDLAKAIADALAPAMKQLSEAAAGLTQAGQELALQAEKSRAVEGEQIPQPRLPQQRVAFDPNTGLPAVATQAPPPIRRSLGQQGQPQQQAPQPQQMVQQQPGQQFVQGGFMPPPQQPQPVNQGSQLVQRADHQNPTPHLRGLIRGQYNL